MSVQTMAQLANVLQEHLLPEIQDVLYSDSILFSKLEENLNSQPLGNDELKVSLRTARAGVPGGYGVNSDIPSANAKHERANVKIKMITARFESAENLLRQVQKKDTSALVNYITEQQDSLSIQYKRILQSMIYGDANEGGRTIATVASNSTGTTVTVDGETDRPMAEYLVPGMYVLFDGGDARVVDDITGDETFTVTSAVSISDGDAITQAAEGGESTVDITGLKTIVDDGNTYLGLNRANKTWFRSQVMSNETLSTSNIEDKLEELFLKTRKFLRGGDKAMTITNTTGWRTYGNALSADRQFVNPDDGMYSGGYTALYLNNKDNMLILDYDAPSNEIYTLTPKSLSWGVDDEVGKKVYFLDRDGSIFRSVNKRTTYETVAAMFAELYSPNPRGLGKMENITFS